MAGSGRPDPTQIVNPIAAEALSASADRTNSRQPRRDQYSRTRTSAARTQVFGSASLRRAVKLAAPQPITRTDSGEENGPTRARVSRLLAICSTPPSVAAADGIGKSID